jgi:HNH endonuclease
MGKQRRIYSWERHNRLTDRDLRWIIIRRDGRHCHWCGDRMVVDQHCRAMATLEHLTPKSQGGTNDLRNLAVACADCNEGRAHDAQVAVNRLHEEWVAVTRAERNARVMRSLGWVASYRPKSGEPPAPC